MHDSAAFTYGSINNELDDTTVIIGNGKLQDKSKHEFSVETSGNAGKS